MADQKISERGTAATLTGAEIIGAIQGGADKKTTAQEIADLAGGNDFSGFPAATTNDGTELFIATQGGVNKTFTPVVTKAALALTNVDNTSDANKPVSTAQATAIALKATDANVVHITGNETIAGTKTFNGDIQSNGGMAMNGGNFIMGSGIISLGGSPGAAGQIMTSQGSSTPLWKAHSVVKGYKEYTILLSQQTTTAPTADLVFMNELSAAIVWTRTGVGEYIGTLAGAFTASKTAIFPMSLFIPLAGIYVRFYRIDVNTIGISATNTSFAATDINTLQMTCLTIKVYY